MTELNFTPAQLREWASLAEQQNTPGAVVRITEAGLVVGLQATR